MTENRIKEIRTRKKLTQKELADAAGTSQQQIQRIEAGVQEVRFDLAARVSEALGEPLEKVFPTTALPLRRAKKKHSSAWDIVADQTSADELERAGLDMDASQWTFVYRLRGGACGRLPVGRRERDRLWSMAHQNGKSEFIVLDKVASRVALNQEHLIFCQFLFDLPSHVETTEEEERSAGYSLDVVLSDSAEVHNFRVEPDEVDLDEEDDPDPMSVQLQDVFFHLENDSDLRVKFQDMDGETAFFRTSDVAMISVDLEAVEPKLLAVAEDEEGQETSDR